MNIGKRTSSLLPVVEVDQERCVNCHACITVCPVKFCNDGSGDHVTINHDMCIGCGSCLKRCTHNARYYIDDYTQFEVDLASGVPVVAIVAPSIVASFGEEYLKVNGWLKSKGVEAVFDVSFGAELTVKSYVEHIMENKPQTVIAQPCPAIVTYLELYMPELLQNLAPVDSPMLHTMKMIREYYPEYAQHKIAVISPCLAKKREFQELGLGEYNIGFKTVAHALAENETPLSSFESVAYVNPPAERGVLFSSPGGLLETMKRWVPDMEKRTRKIEGVHTVYDYLSKLPEAISNGSAPLLVDCLNCEFGCNSGPLTLPTAQALDTVEGAVRKRKNEQQKEFSGITDMEIQEEVDRVLSKYWRKALYRRSYRNLSMNNRIFYPDESQLKAIYESMHKYESDDMYNCSSCGYESCENMAVAIHHGLNRAENCHFYMAEEARTAHDQISENEKRLRTILFTANQGFCLTDAEFSLITVNPTLCEMFGTTKERLVGTKVFEGQFQNCIKNNRDSIEIRIKTPDGTNRLCLFTPTPYHDNEGELQGYFAFVTDISSYKKAIIESTSGGRVPM